MQEDAGMFEMLKAAGETSLQPTEIVSPEHIALTFKGKMWGYEERTYNT